MLEHCSGPLLAALLVTCVLVLPTAGRTGIPAGGAPNVLFVIADDIGVDRIGAYAEHPDPRRTPVIDQLAADGVLFRNVWGQPSCSPTRAALLTGRLPFRTGIGRALGNWTLALDEVTLAEVLRPSHATWAVGKWHLSAPFDLQHALHQGFDHHHGTHSNLGGAFGPGYTSHWKIVDETSVFSTQYATTEVVDDAIAFIRQRSEPWFLWLAFHAPHSPFHKPPQALHGYDLPENVAANVPVHMQAMAEAMDTELGRLFDSVDPEVWDQTLIVFVGDNGTDGQATTAPFDPEHAKSTIYEGGINVPLIVRGPGVVAGAECGALIQTSDLFATVAEWVGQPQTTGDDSLSLVPYLTQPALPSLRSWVYSEVFHPLGFGPFDFWDQAARDERYKLIRFHDRSLVPTREEFYDLELDPFEQVDLLQGPLTAEQASAYEQLTQDIRALIGPWRQLGHALTSSLPPLQPTAIGQAVGLPGSGFRTAHPAQPAGYTPQLSGSGALVGGDAMTVEVQHGPASAQVLLVVGFQQLSLPFQGGVLEPSPDLIVAAPTDLEGGLALTTTWPLGVPPQTLVYLQGWLLDPAGPGIHSATNGLAIVSP